MVVDIRPFFDELHRGLASVAGLWAQKSSSGSKFSSAPPLQHRAVTYPRSLGHSHFICDGASKVVWCFFPSPLFCITMTSVRARMGSFDASSLPIRSTEGSIESPRPFLSNNELKIGNAMPKGIRNSRPL